MEENLPEFENRQELIIADEVALNLRSAMIWSKFLAIVGFIMTGMLFVLSLLFLFVPRMFGPDYMMEGVPDIMGAATMPGRLAGTIYLIMAVIMFFLYYFLFMGSVKIKRSIDLGERGALVQGTRNLKYYFQMQGILYIISLALVVLGLILVFTVMSVFI